MIATLDERSAAILQMRFAQGLALREIGAKLGMSGENVRLLLTRTKKRYPGEYRKISLTPHPVFYSVKEVLRSLGISAVCFYTRYGTIVPAERFRGRPVFSPDQLEQLRASVTAAKTCTVCGRVTPNLLRIGLCPSCVDERRLRMAVGYNHKWREAHPEVYRDCLRHHNEFARENNTGDGRRFVVRRNNCHGVPIGTVFTAVAFQRGKVQLPGGIWLGGLAVKRLKLSFERG